MKTVIEMALQAGIFHEYDSEGQWDGLTNEALVGKDYLTDKEHKLKRIAEILTPFAELVRADERNRTWTQEHWTEYEHSIRNATLDEIADKIGKMPFGDTAASFAVWIREQKHE